MAGTSENRELAERFAGRLLPLGPVEIRRFFSGSGLSLDGTLFAFVVRGTLWLRVDEAVMVPEVLQDWCARALKAARANPPKRRRSKKA